MTFGQRFALSLTITLAVLFALATCGYMSGRWEAEAQGKPASLQPKELSKYEKEFIELDRHAVRQAYENQIMLLFQSWMKDNRDQPARARIGAIQARKAFEQTWDAINEREQRLQREGR